MRVALLTDGIYPYVIGGMQKHSYFLAKFFAQNGVDIDLYHCNQSQLNISELACFTPDEKKHIRSFVFEFPKANRIPGHYNKQSYDYSCMLYDEFQKHDLPDFIYAKGYAGWKFMEEKKKGNLSTPIGVRLHGYEVYQATNSLKVKFWNWLYKKTFEYNNIHADYVYSYGGKITDIIRNNLPIDASKIIEIPTGIESSWICKTNIHAGNPLRFAFLGRYDIRKGIQELNEALRSFNNDSRFLFQFIGPVPDGKRLNLPNVKYLGQISDAQKIKSILQNCDVLVLPSHSEGMPNVIMEAMASGCAIIATDVGAIHRMVDSSNGILIPPFSPDAIRTAMLRIIALSKEELQALKSTSVKKVEEQFLWEQVIKQEISEIKKRIA